MRGLKILTLAITICMLCWQISLAGPFGTEMGDARDKYKGLKNSGNLYYEAFEVPRPHSRLSRYLLGFSKTGLSRVIGFTEFERDAEGYKGLALYRSLLKALTEKYGEPGSTGGNISGSYWTKGMATWDRNLPDNLKSIMLSLYSQDGYNSRLDVFYVYKNNPTAEEWEQLDKEAL